MRCKRCFVAITLAVLSWADSRPGAAAERMVGVLPSDGTTMLVKRFAVTAGSSISGVTFENNDARTVFPELLLVRNATASLGDGQLVARVADVSMAAAGVVQVLWPQPVHVPEDATYYVAVRFPSGSVKQGLGNGPGLGVNASRECSDSFVAGGAEGELTALRADLSISLGLASAGKASASGRIAPQTFLAAGTPNPAISAVKIQFGVERALPVRLAIYDVAGRQVRLLANGVLDAGQHTREWDGRDERGQEVSAGVYIAKLQAGPKVIAQKLVLAK